jgi:hypothetical protein
MLPVLAGISRSSKLPQWIAVQDRSSETNLVVVGPLRDARADLRDNDYMLPVLAGISRSSKLLQWIAVQDRSSLTNLAAWVGFVEPSVSALLLREV